MFLSRSLRLFSVFAAMFVAFSMVTIDHADARRGGSFGSRGTRTQQTVPPTTTSPNVTAPVDRSMTSRPQNNPGAQTQTTATNRPGFFGAGFGGSLMRGLFLGGLIGLFMGYGFGGIGGLFSLLFQVLLIGGLVWLVMRMFASRSSPALAGGPRGMGNTNPYQRQESQPYRPAQTGGGTGSRGRGRDEVGITGADFDTFEQRLSEVQDAYAREDYAALRRITTPEVMSYLSEELGENASRGLKNSVEGTKLLQGDLAEAWREGNRDYATVAMRYSSIDVTRERQSGRVVEGDPDQPTETREVWTFTREGRGPWLLSAIQEA